MFNSKLFIFFLVFPSISCDELVDFVVNKMVNSSVDPCDNFYRHVCSDTSFGAYDLIGNIYNEEMNKTFNATDDVSSYLIQLLQCQKTEYVAGTVLQKLKSEYKLACENGRGKQFTLALRQIFELPTTFACDDTSDLYSFLDSLDSEISGFLNDICSRVVPSTKERLWLHQHMNVFDDFKNIFDSVKNVYYNWVEKTPSINNNNVTGLYKLILNSTHLEDQSASDYIRALTREYKKCEALVGHWLNDSEVSNILCNIQIGARYLQNIGEVDTNINAGNTLESIGIGLKFFTAASNVETRAFYLGQYGFIIGHELGHSVIQSLGDSFDLFFSNRTTDCIESQFRKTCSTFPEQSCKEYESRIDDDGADLLGGRGSIHIAMQELGETFYQASEKYSGLTNAKLFFYGLASPLCNLAGFDEKHSPNVVRFNAVAVQSPEFQEAFQCKPNSKMMQSLHRKCYILGENASTQKHSGI